MTNKTFKDQLPPDEGRKYRITGNPDGTSSIEDVTQYRQYGTPFGAKEVNELYSRVAEVAPDYTAATVKMPYNWIDGHAIYRRVITLVPSQMTEIQYTDTPSPDPTAVALYQYVASKALTGIDTILPMGSAMMYTSGGNVMPLGYIRHSGYYDAGYGFLPASGPNYDITLYTGQRQAAEIAKVILIVYYTAV